MPEGIPSVTLASVVVEESLKMLLLKKVLELTTELKPVCEIRN